MDADVSKRHAPKSKASLLRTPWSNGVASKRHGEKVEGVLGCVDCSFECPLLSQSMEGRVLAFAKYGGTRQSAMVKAGLCIDRRRSAMVKASLRIESSFR